MEVVVPGCFMTDCGQTSPSIKKHIVGKHLSITFATWKEMPNEERMVCYNQSLISLEGALGLSNLDELLQLVVEKKWFPLDTRFTIPEEDVKFVKAFHQWLTGNQLTSKPTVEPPPPPIALLSLPTGELFPLFSIALGRGRISVISVNL